MIRPWFRASVGLLAVVFVVGSLAGCANLRKKFTRKKKKKQVEQFIPVLEPEKYTNSSNDPLKAYHERYVLWRTWYTEMQVALDYKEGQKRKLYVLRELAKQLGAMEMILPADLRPGMQDVMKDMDDLIKYIDQPDFLWEESIVKKRLRKMEKTVRNQYMPSVVQSKF